MDHPRQVTPSRRDEQGLALILALLFTIIVSGLTLSGSLYLKAHIQKNRTSFASKSQALQVAKSGLAEALNWMRRQTSQPVLAFEPRLDTGASPQILDTIEPDIGLVREFKITGKIWARYEVWKEWEGDTDPDRLAWRRQYQCQDVSAARSDSSAGTVWRLRSIGYIYELADPNVAFDTSPNRVVSSQVAVNEVRRMVIGLPGTAALNVDTGSTCVINTNGRIRGGTTAAGVYYPASTGSPTAPASRVSGAPAVATAVAYDGGYEAVFGVTWDELVATATLVVDDVANLPTPIPDLALVVIDAGNISLDSTHRLQGAGIVIVRGNLTLTTGNASNFSGMLYVDGNLELRSPCEINGAIVCTGSVQMQGSSAFATLNYDGTILNTLMNELGNYRTSHATYLPRLGR
ncbi:MAG: hypothetical protein JNK15_18510 [Planctomycetes bacterium]|nr:hypothetical protein [Planctomycetota bacterium]